MKIHWTVERLDEDEEPDPAIAEICALTIQGRIEVDGGKAGQLSVWHLISDDLESRRAFMELWDLDGDVRAIYEDVINPERTKFREPLARMLEDAPGLLVVDFVVLRPAFRGKGLGREVLREIVRCCAGGQRSGRRKKARLPVGKRALEEAGFVRAPWRRRRRGPWSCRVPSSRCCPGR